MSTNERGAFIVIEGLDRCGKSTQCKKLFELLTNDGRSVELMRFPDRETVIGKMIHSYLNQESDLDDHAIHLLFAANRWEKSAMIHSQLQSGTTLICDRYAFSGVAFTSAKFQLRTPPQPESFISLSSPDRGLPLPDLVIFLTMPMEAMITRGGFGQERYEKEDLQAEVKRQFKQVVEPAFTRLHGQGRWVEIDASGSIEEVTSRISKTVDCLLGSKLDPVVGNLWAE
ncbi:thymidylate kinase-domain-containing protein [Melampsora americana]|nr:thymidylate kinase-domain-containing protein [Melampsora americana]